MKSEDRQAPPEPSQESASLLKRLAGPSSTKAGSVSGRFQQLTTQRLTQSYPSRLVQDQHEINRIIAEVSKGSKFYEASSSIGSMVVTTRNEKRKDKELSEKINSILKQREAALNGVDSPCVIFPGMSLSYSETIEITPGAIERQVDHIVSERTGRRVQCYNDYDGTQLEELEDERDLSQTIVHVDMDAFYASVELLHDPSLKGKPFGVGGGVLSTASYEARKYGVRSGMAEFVAKKLCPDLIVVKLNFKRYSEMSERCMKIFRRYDPNMFAAGCDEGYLNTLTVSAGIAPNKNKPNGQYYLAFDRDSIKMFMHDLPIRKVPGIGRVHERLLDAIGIRVRLKTCGYGFFAHLTLALLQTCGDIYDHRTTLYLMDKQFGLRFLLRTYLGITSNVVQAGRREERKSIGAERTFRALSDKHLIFSKLEDVSDELARDMVSGGWTGKTVTLKCKLDNFEGSISRPRCIVIGTDGSALVFTRAKSFDRWVSQKKEDLFAIGKELLLPELPLTIRLIGLRVTKLKDLHAAEPTGGIKRFLETPGSSRKKAKLEVDIGEDPELEEEDDSMPAFFEEEGLDLDHPGHGDETMEGPDDTLSNWRDKPNSAIKANLCSEATSRGDAIQASEASASGSDPSSHWQLEPEHHSCPICNKQLNTDNQGLNSHIDFCLSKGAIMEAQVEASSPKKLGFKPSSKNQMRLK
ncbi:DNA/RNA polymerase [Chiua virens]|nr:DNA/RNA polymerase [Chiua virens]